MSAAPAAGEQGWTARSMYGLALLTLIYALNYADRQILGLVLPLMKREMHLSDTALGLVTGFAFVLFYSVMGVPIARLADRSNRRNILAVGLAFWSAMTLFTGAVTNLWQLALTRFFMGAGEASGVAPSTSMVADMFSKARRPLAMAILTSGSALASLLFFPIIGVIAQNYGWRACFVAAGVLGIGLSLVLFLTVPEPARVAATRRAAPPENTWGAARFLFASPAFALTVVGGSFIGVSLYSAQVWHPSFLARVHHMNMAQIGASIGVVRGLAGLAGTLIGGVLAARLGQRDDRWRLWIPGIACLMALPAELLFLFSPALPAALVGLLLYTFCVGMHFGPVYAVCQTVAPARMRATATATFLLFANSVGQIVGPLVVGYLNDRWAALYGAQAIRYSLIVGAACAFAGGTLLILGARRLAADTARAEAQN